MTPDSITTIVAAGPILPFVLLPSVQAAGYLTSASAALARQNPLGGDADGVFVFKPEKAEVVDAAG
ncbi:MAG: hypothetical protein ABSE35_24875 [Bryobacteraceae bacterium]